MQQERTIIDEMVMVVTDDVDYIVYPQLQLNFNETIRLFWNTKCNSYVEYNRWKYNTSSKLYV
jgi:hypothetical protein